EDSRAEGWQMTEAGEIVVERDLMVPARDGVLLATDVYRPEGSGPFPVLLERTPYDKSAVSRSGRNAADARPRSRAEFAAYFVGHGYAVAYQDPRKGAVRWHALNVGCGSVAGVAWKRFVFWLSSRFFACLSGLGSGGPPKPGVQGEATG